MSTWTWPVANDEPTAGDYLARHPTRYFFHPKVEEWARWLVDNYGVSANTYYEHPEGYGWNVAVTDSDGTKWYNENTSMDVWGPNGRGDPIDRTKGDQIFKQLFNYPNPPIINWIIWQATIYGAWNGWKGESFGTDDFSWHQDHIHVTYAPAKDSATTTTTNPGPGPGGGTDSTSNPSSSDLAIAIDPWLDNHGKAIVAEARATGLDLAEACGLVEQESNGKNIFGGDAGDVGDTPPYYHQEVTRERVQALRAGGSYTYGMNGVGLTQLTWWTLVEDAEALGGAHLPENQCHVGFALLKRYLDTYSRYEALGAYNAGEDNRALGVSNGYAAGLDAKVAAWRTYLAGVKPGTGGPVTPPGKPDDKDKPLYKKYGWYGFESDTSWNLTYYPPEGGGTPQGKTEPEYRSGKAHRKTVEEVTFHEEENDTVKVEHDEGTTVTLTKAEFEEKYEVEEGNQ